MAAATPYRTLIYKQIWLLLENRTELTAVVPSGDRIKASGGKKPPLYPYRMNKAPRDTPEIVLRLKNWKNAFFAFNATIAQESGNSALLAAGDGDWIEEQTALYELTVTHRDYNLEANDQLEAEIEAALRAGYPNLGLSYINKFGPVVATTIEGQQTPEASKQDRPVTRIQIPVVSWMPGPDQAH